MKHYHGIYKKHSYFEGWYFKHQCEEETLALIPGVQFDEEGRHSAFIQLITEDTSYFVPYPFPCFHASSKRFNIQVGENRFNSQGIRLFIDTPHLQLKGALYYGQFSPLNYDIMGPFCKIPLMECKHGVISMSHKVTGQVELNGKKIIFTEGTGYIEKDWGQSFPKTYLWTQCNEFSNATCAIMASVADIPFLKSSFRGCICSIQYNGKEYRLATYLGVKVILCSKEALILQQGSYTLQVFFKSQHPRALKAPMLGHMKRTIHESVTATVQYRFSIHDQVLFDLESNKASFEFVDEKNSKV